MKRVFLCGIGGIGMANFAVLLKEAGYAVSGSDGAVYEPAANILRTAGIQPVTPYAADNVPQDGTIIIVGNAQSREHVEVNRVLDQNLPVWSFPDFLHRHILADRHRMIVAGTHGKSSTTACLAHLLRAASSPCGHLVGALPVGANSGAAIGDSKAPFVLEGDEYDTAFFDKRSKFLHYFPHTLVLGTVEYDHADIFPSKEDMLVAFRRLMMLLPSNGVLVYHSDCEETRKLAEFAACRKIAVGKSGSADWQLLPNAQRLAFRDADAKTYECSFELPGEHQRLNALMALAAAHSYGSDLDAYLRGISTFRGLRRRLEKLFDSPELTVYDDFAHHPTAIAATLRALRERYPHRRLLAVIEPRSNTMVRKIFQQDLPRALTIADHVVLGSVHRAERIPVSERLDVQEVVHAVMKQNIMCEQVRNEQIVDQIVPHISSKPTTVVFMSNGGFDSVPQNFLLRIGKLNPS